jgi:hypothetical protein
MLLVVLRPADRETVGGEPEEPAGDREDDGQWRQARPASASSTSVAWATPVAPREAYDVALRK